MKRSLSFFLMLALLLTIVLIGSFDITASAATDGYYTYEVSNGEATITDCDDFISGAITIPSTLGGYPVTGIDDFAFSNCTYLTSIVIPDGIADIGTFSFGASCLNLEGIWVDERNVNYSSDDRGVLFNEDKTQLILAPGKIDGCYVIPDSVTGIGDHAFYNRTYLTSIVIPDSVTDIGTDAFMYCWNLEGIWVDERNANYSSDDRGVLFNEDKTQLILAPAKIAGSYAIPVSVTDIGSWAFNCCNGLTSIEIPGSVTGIGYGAFYFCANLANITIPDSVTTIGDHAFSHCTGLTNITIPDSVTTIGYSAFYGCTGLTSVTISEGVIKLGPEAFYGCTGLTSVTIPDSVIHIGEAVFGGCTNLEYLNTGDLARWCGRDTALNCWPETWKLMLNGTVVTDLVLPDGSNISQGSFRGCTSLTSVKIPDGAFGIREFAFYDCTGLTSLVIPESLKVICAYTFYNCDALTDVYYAGTEEQRQSIEILSNNDDLINANWHYEVTDVPKPVDPKPEDPKPVVNPFTDVAEKSYYYTPVLWAVKNKVTSGVSAVEFAPDNPCTRGQVVTFLWRAKGSPEPKSTIHPFTDVDEKAFYYKAMLWAVENGITAGLNKTSFGPGEICTRSQVVTFLWRTMGKPAVSNANHPFTDVSATAFYYTPMLWAVENGITSGTSTTTFAPDQPCTRGQVVTFLYRTLN